MNASGFTKKALELILEKGFVYGAEVIRDLMLRFGTRALFDDPLSFKGW
jgi:hypothetical protein